MNIEDIKQIVIEGYRNILKREPDPSGFENYIYEINNGLSIERFHEVLRLSEEYKQRFGTQVTPSNPSITYCMIGGNKLHEIKDYIPGILSYIDKFVYIDSGSTDGSIEFLKDLSSKNNNKIDVIIREWQDKFSYFRNYYLEHLRNQNYNGWVIVSDTDEYYPSETLSQLANLVRDSNNGINYSGIQFRAYDILTDDNDKTKIISQSLSTYWKGLMFKFHPNLRYEGEPHESFSGAPIIWKKTDFIYKHVRTQRKIYERAIENFFISNSNRYSSKWAEFRVLCSRNGMPIFSDFIKKYKEGTLSKEIEDWIYNHRNDNENDGDSEVREMATLLFKILHPEKLKNRENTI